MYRAWLLFLSISIVAGAANGSAAQDIRSLLVETSGFTTDDLIQLDQGEVVVRSTSTTNKYEVATIGAVRIKDLPSVSMAAFRDSFSQRANTEVAAKGMFSPLPSVSDLAGFELEDRDYGVLRKCVVADCDVNMSAAWIRRFGTEMKWSRADHRQTATDLFRTMLLDYLTLYTKGGADALGEYANEKRPVALGETHRKLLSDVVLLQRLSPELFEALKEFPAIRLVGLENEYYWSTVDFGFNPTVTLTHTATYTSDDGTNFVAARQFYSSRYLDASVSLTIMARGADGAQYVVFTDRSSSDALGGILHGVSSGVVENETLERIRRLLEKAELRLIAQSKPVEPPANSSPAGEREAGWSDPRIIAVSAILAMAVLATIYTALKRAKNK